MRKMENGKLRRADIFFLKILKEKIIPAAHLFFRFSKMALFERSVQNLSKEKKIDQKVLVDNVSLHGEKVPTNYISVAVTKSVIKRGPPLNG